jgi:hypothetical protein
MNGRVQFYNEGTASQAGQPITLSVNGLTASSFAYSLPPHASVHFDTAGLSSTTQIGSVIVTPESGSNSPVGQVLFSLVNNGIHVTEAPVAAQPVSSTFRLFVQTGSSNGAALTQPNSFESGLAISNPSSTATTVTLQLFDSSGASTGSPVSLNLQPFAHVAKFLHELFPSVAALISNTGFTFRPARLSTATTCNLCCSVELRDKPVTVTPRSSRRRVSRSIYSTRARSCNAAI